MRLSRLLIVLAAVCPALAAQPLHEIAEKAGAKLPAGGIVTAESIAGTTRFAAAGKLEPADIAPENRVFEIGSITKVFTGLLLADAVEHKKVRLDSTLKELLDGQVSFIDPDVAAITLVQLSTHTSGLPRLPDNMGWFNALSKDPYKAYDRNDALKFLAKAELPHAPPFPSSYSNYGVGLLGELISGIHGKSYADLVAEKITGPLGMKDTMVLPGEAQQMRLAPPYNGAKPSHSWTFQAMAGAGALRSTAADLVTFGQALLEPDKTPLSAAIKGMLTVHAPYEDSGAEIGLGIMIDKIDGHREYSHSGGTGGYRSALQVIPDLKIIRVALVNNTAFGPASLFGKTRDDKHSDAPEQKLSAEELDAFTGVFESGPQARFTVVRRDDHLHVRLTGQPFFPVKCIGKDRFRYDAVVAELQFGREEDAVSSLVLHQNGREVPAKRSGDAPTVEFPTAEALDAYAGEYALFPGKVFTITRKDDTLMAQLTGQPEMPVFASKPDYFEYDVVEAAIEFQRDAADKVTGLILHQNGKHTAKKR
ncbi:serine hydrolase [Luteolibacter arcticus]|uniref:Serine hydrolase n=1 Tax=Luteolibacter arcticus TaxID=1581411 RepID=A0ABT3GJZ1_9BACT|nr:serine hydrolase [Luteolibacter arcticus]MCW1923818.1 serine hydrolase [Luteolibacter arcticus]